MRKWVGKEKCIDIIRDKKSDERSCENIKRNELVL